MTGEQIVQDALRHAAVDGYQINDTYAMDYINAAVDEIIVLRDEIGKKDSTTYSIDNTNVSTWLDLPDDFLTEKRTYATSEGSKLITAKQEPYFYMIENEQIRFDFKGDYTMEYLKEPDALTDLKKTPDIPKIYHRPMAFYVAGRIKSEIFGEEDSERNEFMALFERNVARAGSRLKTRKRRRMMPPPSWS